MKDEGFIELVSVIKTHTGVKQISYTTGPKRGEIVWADKENNTKLIKE
jgi:hypothetical protein